MTCSFWKVRSSTLDKMTEECISQPASPGIWARDFAASALSLAQIVSAMRTSSTCRCGLCPPRHCTFSCWIGSMISGEMSSMFSSTPARALRAFNTMAEEAPIRGEVLPVITLPSGSKMAAAGAPVTSAFRLAAATAGLSMMPVSAFVIKISSCSVVFLEWFPLQTSSSSL